MLVLVLLATTAAVAAATVATLRRERGAQVARVSQRTLDALHRSRDRSREPARAARSQDER